MHMSLLAVWIGSLLAALGVIGYVASGMASWTAMIPAFLGLPILICGIIGLRNEKLRKHVMHVALLICLLGIIGTFSGLIAALSMLTGTEVERPQAVLAQAGTAVLCLVFLFFGIRSFVRARLMRSA